MTDSDERACAASAWPRRTIDVRGEDPHVGEQGVGHGGLLKYGVDTIKLNLSGEYIAGLAAEATPMTDAEIATAVEEVRKRGKR
ncbi:MAG TPA: hypothetical protein VEA81_03330, partial [Burkholderiaceae bacterium]|nr:hypothetical protein [Burkholderiaceae bacterium]